jgi:hypothetical protein
MVVDSFLREHKPRVPMRFFALVCGVFVAFLPLASATSPGEADTGAEAVVSVPSELVADVQRGNQRIVGYA